MGDRDPLRYRPDGDRSVVCRQPGLVGAASRPRPGGRDELVLVPGVKVLITGASGQLGQDLVPAFDGHDVVAAAGHRDFDLTDRDAVLSVITTVRPDAIVHAAAWT